jgi:hypothetical protein
MRNSFAVRIFGALSICSALLVSSCGGGGGDAGTSLFPSTSSTNDGSTSTTDDGSTSNAGDSSTTTTALTVLPQDITAAAGDSVTLNVVGGTPPYTAYTSAPNTATIANVLNAGGSSVLVNLLSQSTNPVTITVQDAANTTATVSLTVTAPSNNILLAIPAIQLSQELSSTLVNFQLQGGTGPYYVTMPATVGGVATLNFIDEPQLSWIASSSASSLAVPLKAVCIASDKFIPLTITDMSNGNTTTATVEIVNSNSANDGTSGCL